MEAVDLEMEEEVGGAFLGRMRVGKRRSPVMCCAVLCCAVPVSAPVFGAEAQPASSKVALVVLKHLRVVGIWCQGKQEGNMREAAGR